MKEIVKVLLEKGIDEETIHEVLNILEDIPSQIEKRYPKETFSDKEYEKRVHDKHDELMRKYEEMQRRKEDSDKERAIGKRPEVKSSKPTSLFDIDFGAFDTPEQRKYDEKERRYERQQRWKTPRTERGQGYTTERQFPGGKTEETRAIRRSIGKRKAK